MQQPGRLFFSGLGFRANGAAVRIPKRPGKSPDSQFRHPDKPRQNPEFDQGKSETRTFPTAVSLCCLLFSIPRPAAVYFLCGRRARGFTLSSWVQHETFRAAAALHGDTSKKREGGVKDNAAFFLEDKSLAGLFCRCRDGRYTRVDRPVIKAAQRDESRLCL